MSIHECEHNLTGSAQSVQVTVFGLFRRLLEGTDFRPPRFDAYARMRARHRLERLRGCPPHRGAEMQPSDLDEFIARLKTASDLGTIASIVEEALRKCGFDRFAYLLIHPPGGPIEPVYIGNYPEAWSEHYVANDYVNIDPVMSTASNAIAPINWQDLSSRLPARSAQRRVLNEAREFGLRGGITVPVHGPAQGFATMNVAADVSDDSFAELWQQNRHLLQLIGLYSHEAVTRLGTSSVPRTLPKLAPRERECLLWTARGKTAWEIAAILSLSQETVVHYLKSAGTKLSVHNKTHAVVKAILLGLIHP